MSWLRLDTRERRVTLMVILFLLALAVRLPGLLDFPRFEDEGLEVMWGLDIAQGRHFPLTGSAAYFGPLFAYLMAGTFYLLGVDVLWPRLPIAVFGAMTVPATYALGRTVADSRVGVVAALMALTSPGLVLVSSRYAWSNSLTPFFATLTVIAVYVGVTQRRSGVLALGGGLAGLTAQTHPLSMVMMAGLAIWYARSCPPKEWFRRREVYAALAGFGVGYAPMIWSLVTSWTVVIGRVRDQTYAYDPAVSPVRYLARLPPLVLSLNATAAGAFLVAFWAIVIVALVKRAELARLRPSRARGLAYVLVTSVLLLPVISRSFPPRYLVCLLPVAFVWLGDLMVRLWASVATARPTASRTTAWPTRRGTSFVAGLVIMGVGIDVLAIAGAWHYVERQGTTNAAFWAVRHAVLETGVCRNKVFIEDTDTLNVPSESASWAYFNLHALQYVLALSSCQVTTAPAGPLLESLASYRFAAWLIVPEESVPAFSQRLGLERVMAVIPGPSMPENLRLALFRVTPPLPPPPP